jgi:RNA polymerase sigma factor (TIGR02999 family)
MGNGAGDVTQLLQQWRAGDFQAERALFELLLPDLRKIAGCCFRGERSGHTLQPTALVNEAFVRLVHGKNIEWLRGHFSALAARIMRRFLIDHARAQPSVQFLPMEGFPERVLGRRTPLDIAITIDDLLNELEKESPQRRSVVELKFFLGMTDKEAADALNLKLHTFQREWHRARLWLFKRLTVDHAN